MLNNWINGKELVYLLRRVMKDETFRHKLFFKLHLTRDARVKASWAHTEAGPSGWWEIPAIQRRWNSMISGDPAIAHPEYVAQHFLRDHQGLRGLSLGCGTGVKETHWAKTGKFVHIDAFDLSPQRIQAAREAIRNTPEEEIITYDVADVTRYTWLPQTYEVVLFDNSLHHFPSLETLLQGVARTLKPDGVLVVNEFVGPSRFQWTDNQLAAVNALVRQFPREYRTYHGTSFTKDTEVRPSRLRMLLSDPSEAIESSKILPVLKSTFDVLEIKGYGGALLHLLFSDIAHHFVQPDEVAERLLQDAISREDELMAGGQIDHDFALVICRTKQS
jgi:ubiquinone/menaquinone biosynthesis C-methylase UbiE